MDRVGNRFDLRNFPGLRKCVLAYVGFFGILLGLRLVSRGVEGVVRPETIWFLLGGVMGMVLPIFDRMVYVYYSQPEEPLSIEVKALVREKKYLQVLKVLYERRKEQLKLAMNNVLFLVVWVVLALFLITSSPSFFAKGMILGIGLEMVISLYEDWKNKKLLIARLFWPIKQEVSLDELKIVVAVFVGAFVVTGLMAV